MPLNGVSRLTVCWGGSRRTLREDQEIMGGCWCWAQLTSCLSYLGDPESHLH